MLEKFSLRKLWEKGSKRSRSSLEQVGRLTMALIISGGLNIILLVMIGLGVFHGPDPITYDHRPVASNTQEVQTVRGVLRAYQATSFEQLITQLRDTTLVEDGWTQRDLALGWLVTAHDFDLSRALIHHPQPLQTRTLRFTTDEGQRTLAVSAFPGLSEGQFRAITTFANTERWPITSEGLFFRLQQQQETTDPTLAETFFLTPEFQSVEMLFARATVAVKKKELLSVLTQGNWKTLTAFTEKQRLAQDLSPQQRRKFLFDYMAQNSQAAASLLLKTDPRFVVRRLDDRQIIELLSLLNEKTPLAERLAVDLLTSPRSDAVWKAASACLYTYAGEAMPLPYDHVAALNRFVSETMWQAKLQQLSQPTPTVAVEVNTPMTSTERLIHQVQKGDTLWKISRQYQVSVQDIRSLNGLASDTITPGQKLTIPQAIR